MESRNIIIIIIGWHQFPYTPVSIEAQFLCHGDNSKSIQQAINVVINMRKNLIHDIKNYNLDFY